MQQSGKAIIFIVIILIVGVGSALAYAPVTAFLDKTFPKFVNVEVPEPSQAGKGLLSSLLPTNKTSTGLPVTDLNDPDLNGLDMTFAKIRQASIDNNLFLLEQYWSEPTRAVYVGTNAGKVIKPLKDMSFNNIRKINKLKVLVAVKSVEMSGHSEVKNLLFVRETKGWRMGIVETEQYYK